MANEPNETETEPAQGKRSKFAKELKTLGELVRLLKPFSPEDRKRLLDTANFMMGEKERNSYG